MNLGILFLLFLKGSLVSTSGLGNLPVVHTDLIARKWASERMFGEALAIGQMSPGPNGLWVLSLGYLAAGFWGAMMALIAIIVPTLLVVLVEGGFRRIESHPVAMGFMEGLTLAMIGIFAAILLHLLSTPSLTLKSVIIAIASGLLISTKKVPVLAIIIFAAIVGVYA